VSDAGDDGRNAAQDFRAIGVAVDEVRVMTYDYSWDTSPPGPIAPADWVREVIAWTVTEIPRHKVVLCVVLLSSSGDSAARTRQYGRRRRFASL
jgi:spore germination protein